MRAVIKFDENIYENQTVGNIQREWFAISKTIPSKEEGRLGVYYDLQNTGFSKTKKFVYSFDLVSNFSEKNKADLFAQVLRQFVVMQKMELLSITLLLKKHLFHYAQEHSS